MKTYAISRSEKGKSLPDATDNYIAIDIETTGLDPAYDAIVEISAVRIVDAVPQDEFTCLVNPGYDIDDFIVELTGITNEMLSSASKIEQVLPSFLSFIGDDILVAHNANFDINFLYDACVSYGLHPLRNNFIDSLRLSRRLFPEERHNRLKDLIKRFNLPERTKHRGLSDAIYAHQIYENLKKYAVKKDINMKELYPKNGRYGANANDIKSTRSSFDTSHVCFERVFVFTGVLEKMPRKDAMQFVVDYGGICGNTVTKKTNYLVLGNNDYCSAIKDGKSGKQKKAETLMLNGQDLEILSENVFYEMIEFE